MSDTTEQTVQVTLRLPREVYERVTQAATDEQRQLEDVLSALVTEGLDTHTTVRQLFERVSAQYCSRLARECKLQQPPDQVLQELRDLRDQVAHELYP